MKTILLLFSVLIVGCSSFRKTALVSMAGSFAGGYMAGHQLAPEGDNKNLHGLLVGSAVSSLVGAGLIYMFDEKQHERNQKNKVSKWLNNKNSFNDVNSVSIHNGYTQNLPKNIQSLINPTQVKFYKTDKWIKKDENTISHIDKEIEFESSTLRDEIIEE